MELETTVIIFFESGRLGNQLFQYTILKGLFPNEKLIFFGFLDLKQALLSVDATIIDEKKISRLFMVFLRKLFSLLRNLRIIGSLHQSQTNSLCSIKKRHGALLGVYLLEPSYFQHQDLLGYSNISLSLNLKHLRKASCWLEEKKIFPAESNLVFLHIRRGDYLTWPDPKYPANLDKKWYLEAMDQMCTKVKNPRFIILTDDYYYAVDCFGDQKDITISNNDQLVDLALMSFCQHGVLSASSLSWWGAWFSKKNNADTGIYIAPYNWIGHRQNKWIPEGFITDWFTYY